MTRPLPPPKRKDPRKRTRAPLVPPGARSRAALGMTAAAALGTFRLQVCAACGTTAYPPRDACPKCLSVDLAFRDVPDGGEVVAHTTIRTSTDLYFRERTPWRIGTVALDCGPAVVAFLHGDVAVPGRVRVAAKLDKAGNAVLIALPESETPHMRDDPLLRELTASPRHRRALVTDGRSAVGRAVAAALARAGASTVFVGAAQRWKPFPEEAELHAIGNVDVVPLDVTDTTSVSELAGEIGGKVDILVNTAEHVRPGGVLSRDGISTMRDEFEANVFGLTRLAQAFGAAMRARGADGANNAAAFVDILPVHALANWPEFGAFSAAAAARLSLLHCLRAEMRPGGVRVMSVFTGPLDDDWRQTVPPPKVTPRQVADAVVKALEEGIEDSFVGDVARDVAEKWRRDPKVLERELGQ